MKITWDGRNEEEVFEFVQGCLSGYIELVFKKDAAASGVFHEGYQCTCELNSTLMRIQAVRADEVHTFLIPLGETVRRSHKKDKSGSRSWIVVGRRPRLKKITRASTFLKSRWLVEEEPTKFIPFS